MRHDDDTVCQVEANILRRKICPNRTDWRRANQATKSTWRRVCSVEKSHMKVDTLAMTKTAQMTVNHVAPSSWTAGWGEEDKVATDKGRGSVR